MSAAALDYVRREHDRDRVAEAYAAALEEAAGGAGVRDAVLAEVGRAAAEVGLAADSPEVGRIGATLRETGL